jgi:tagatose 6-phosphate kinase
VIVTVTLNPALHVGYETERLTLGGTNPVSRVSYRTGGRGLAVARVLHTFGHDVVAAGLAGGASGEMIRAELARAGVATQFTWISGESRRVVEVADEGGPGEGGPGGQSSAITTFCEPAPYITTEELGRLAADYRSLMADATAAVLSGSLPAGLPAETYGSLATYAAEAGVPVVLDAGGSALWHAVTRRPALVIPEPQAGDPAELIAKGAGAVAILSAGQVSVVTGEGRWSAGLAGQPAAAGSAEAPAASGEAAAAACGEAPAGRASVAAATRVAAAASRDALAAGFVPGIALSWSWPDTLAHAVALAASSDPAGDVDLEAYERLLPRVIVTLPGSPVPAGRPT